MITRSKAITGNRIAKIVHTIQAPASIVETIGFARPPVVAVETARVATVPI